MNEIDHNVFSKTFPGNGFERITGGELAAGSGFAKLQKIGQEFRLLKTIVCNSL